MIFISYYIIKYIHKYVKKKKHTNFINLLLQVLTKTKKVLLKSFFLIFINGT
jgi:hypothetical protein